MLWFLVMCFAVNCLVEQNAGYHLLKKSSLLAWREDKKHIPLQNKNTSF